MEQRIGSFEINSVQQGDCLELIPQLPDNCVDVVVTSPPYWGQRLSAGNGTEEDPRDYLLFLTQVFKAVLPKLKEHGIVWINLGDGYNTPVNWSLDDRRYSSLGAQKTGLAKHNSAYTKPRAKRKAFIDPKGAWLKYGNLLALPYRLIIALSEGGYLFRGEVIWRKRNPMPEGRCRRPHRQHEPIFLLAKNEAHCFRVTPPVGTIWDFANEKIDGPAHFSRFPEELPLRCLEAYGQLGPDTVVLDPFSGSGTTGMAALRLRCTYLGFEIDAEQVVASNNRLRTVEVTHLPLFRKMNRPAIAQE